MEALTGHLSSSFPGGQCGLRRSPEVMGKEEVGCSARLCVRAQSARLDPRLGPLLTCTLDGARSMERERVLAFLAVDCQSHPLTLPHSRSDRVGKPRATPQLVASELELSPAQLAL